MRMRFRPWHLLLVLAALAVPIQAGALKGSDGTGSGGGLAVSASLDHCGFAETAITCQINVSWTGVEGAERYSAAVTLADGSVRDMGTIGTGPSGGFSSIWVPYAGDGTYTVTITAWGSDPDGKEKKIADEDSNASLDPDGENDGRIGDEGKGVDDEGAGEDQAPEPGTDTGDDGNAQPGDPSVGGQGSDPAAPSEPATPAPEPNPGEPEPEPSPEPVSPSGPDEPPAATETAPATPQGSSAPGAP